MPCRHDVARVLLRNSSPPRTPLAGKDPHELLFRTALHCTTLRSTRTIDRSIDRSICSNTTIASWCRDQTKRVLVATATGPAGWQSLGPHIFHAVLYCTLGTSTRWMFRFHATAVSDDGVTARLHSRKTDATSPSHCSTHESLH